MNLCVNMENIFQIELGIGLDGQRNISQRCVANVGKWICYRYRYHTGLEYIAGRII